MKNPFLKALVLMLSLSLLSTTWEDDDFSINDNLQEILEIQSNVESGTWRVTSYIDSGEDETNDFNGFSFNFESNGTVTATNESVTKTGTWSITDDDSNDDSSSSSNDDIDFNIFFQVPETDDFEDLNDDWDIISHTNSRIELRDISGGDGSTDNLIFEKN